MEEDEENVVVVHCKGGKGRTGMMVAAWLVRSGLFQQARESLEYFNERRTDKSRGKKNQGVDTPSQVRVRAEGEGRAEVQTPSLPLSLPPSLPPSLSSCLSPSFPPFFLPESLC